MPGGIRIMSYTVTFNIVTSATHPVVHSDCGCKLIEASNQWLPYCYQVAKGTWRCLIYVNSVPRYHHPPDRIGLLKVGTMQNFGRKRAGNMYRVEGLQSTDGAYCDLLICDTVQAAKFVMIFGKNIQGVPVGICHILGERTLFIQRQHSG